MSSASPTANSVMSRTNDELLDKVFPRTKRKRPIKPNESLISIEKARRGPRLQAEVQLAEEREGLIRAAVMSETAVGEKGMVTAPHRAAAEAGAEVLRAGGNAVEAMIAAAAAIAVVYPHMNGDRRRRLHAHRRAGPPAEGHRRRAAAPVRGATIAAYRKKGYDAIPPRGGDAALTVAGAVSVWEFAQRDRHRAGRTHPAARPDRRRDRARARKASRSRTPSARSPPSTSTSWRRPMALRRTILVDGKVPEIGARLKAERLTDTLEQLARAGFADFYRGDIAREIAADLEARRQPGDPRRPQRPARPPRRRRCRSPSPTRPVTTCRRRRKASPRSSSSACSTG